MSYRRQFELQKPVATTAEKSGESAGRPATQPGASETTLHRVIRHVSAGNYQKALDLLRNAGRDPQLRNAVGVCNLRLGRIDEAIRVYRELVLKAGCTWMRPELPIEYKTNFATALLLGGHPTGALELLSELSAESNPTVQRLRAAMRRWEVSLSFWQRLNWWLGKIEPRNCHIPIDFPPGEFETSVVMPDTPTEKPSGPNLRTAA